MRTEWRVFCEISKACATRFYSMSLSLSFFLAGTLEHLPLKEKSGLSCRMLHYLYCIIFHQYSHHRLVPLSPRAPLGRRRYPLRPGVSLASGWPVRQGANWFIQRRSIRTLIRFMSLVSMQSLIKHSSVQFTQM